MKKKIFIGGLCLLATLLGHAQNPVWTLPEKYLSNGQLLPLLTQAPSGGYDGSPALFTSNMIKDENNFIRFFMVDERVYESNGLFVGGLYCNGHDVTGAQEVCIVPDPKIVINITYSQPIETMKVPGIPPFLIMMHWQLN